MPDQTLKNGRISETPTVGDVTSRATSLAHDLITLTELQAKLFYFDVREAGSQSASSVIGLGVMMALALSSIPVMLLGGAHLLSDGMGWSLGASNLVVGGVVGMLALIVGWIYFQKFRRITAVFHRSQQELEDNLEFIKSLVKGPTERPGYDGFNGRH